MLAERDTLTHVANRYRLENVLLQACERAERFRLALSVIALDIDDFKPINDQHGHATGDQTLIRVVECLESCLHADDVLARWGGDEFMVVLPKSNLARARAVAGRMREALRALPAVGQFKLTVSQGIVERRNDESPSALIARVDQALYRAKTAGKDQVCK
ncbi:MAG: Diguanylate cyclase DgcM [Pseudomonas fluorescens]|nr:MAG: Diguanylate cyclase DgcM [Pseudomonas fluorescens]